MQRLQRKSFTRERLAKLKDDQLPLRKQVEDLRCKTDLVYRMLHRPEEVVDLVLPKLLEFVSKKNAPDIEHSRVFCDARTILGEKHCDAQIKLFMILCIMNRDPETHPVFLDGYQDGNPLWKSAEEGKKHFTNKFLPELALLVHNTFRTSFGKSNITHIVFEFVVAANILYLCK